MNNSIVSKTPLPLPPGLMPSASRHDIVDVLSRGRSDEDSNKLIREGSLSHQKEKESDRQYDVVQEKPALPPAKAWGSPDTSSTVLYHIDLQSSASSSGSETATSAVKVKVALSGQVIEQSDADLDQQRKQLFSLFTAGLKEDNEEQAPTSSRTPWRSMTPLKRYNRVAPSVWEEGTPSKSPASVKPDKENYISASVGKSRSSGVPVDSKAKPVTASVAKSAGVKSQKSGSSPASSSSSSDTESNEPHYSKVKKGKPKQQQQLENPYSEINTTPQIHQNVATQLDFSFGSEIIQAMTEAAKQDGMANDSLYDSLREAPAAVPTEDKPQYSSAFYKGLKKHEVAGNIKLVSVRGVSELPESSNVNFNSGGSPGMLPIHYAAGSGNTKALKEILSVLPLVQDPLEVVLGSRSGEPRLRDGVDVMDAEQRTALLHAVHGNHFKCVTMLVEAGASLRARAADHSTPLHEAVYSGSVEMVALLLSLGADGLAKDLEGRTPLHWSTFNRNAKCIDLLLDKVPGIHPDLRDNANMTPLMWAAYHGRPDNVQKLRERGADTSLTDVDGMRAVHWSVQKHDFSTLQVLITPESSLWQDHKGKTVMHQASEQGCAKAVELIKAVRPSSVNDLDHHSRTPLHWATVCNNPEVIRALLSNGADSAVVDSSGRTALDYAIERGLHYCSILITDKSRGGSSYHHVLTLGTGMSIGARTQVQQEPWVASREQVSIDDLTEEQLLHVKTIYTGAWINKFTNEGKGPLHPRFFWIDPLTMRVHWSKSLEDRYIASKDTRTDIFIGVRSSASPVILHRKDFDPMGKHKFAFSLLTNSRVLNLVALSSEDFKSWLNGLQLLLCLGGDQAAKIVNGSFQNR